MFHECCSLDTQKYTVIYFPSFEFCYILITIKEGNVIQVYSESHLELCSYHNCTVGVCVCKRVVTNKS